MLAGRRVNQNKTVIGKSGRVAPDGSPARKIPSASWDAATQRSLDSAPSQVRSCASSKSSLLTEFNQQLCALPLPPTTENIKSVLADLDAGVAQGPAPETLEVVRYIRLETEAFVRLGRDAKQSGYTMAEIDRQGPSVALFCKHAPCRDFGVRAVAIDLGRPSISHLVSLI